MPKKYNKNRLLVVLQVQDEFLKHADSGRSTAYIYRTHIYPQFLISRVTFYRYLTIPAKRELLKMGYEENDG